MNTTIESILYQANQLSSEARHQLVLHLVEPYHMTDAAILHRCYKCGLLECERVGSGSLVEFWCPVEGCSAEFCHNCVKDDELCDQHLDTKERGLVINWP